MGVYNPNYPFVLGNEFAPVALDPVTIDTASAFGYTFSTVDAEIRTARVLMTAAPPGQARRKVLTVETYRNEDAPSTGRMKKIIVPCTSGTIVNSASLTGGAASFADGLNNPSDLKGVLFTGPLSAVRLYFDTSTSNTKLHTALQNARIADISVRYACAGQFNLYNQPFSMSLERASSSTVLLMDDALVGGTSIASGTVTRRSRLGDYNPFWNTTINPNSDMRRAPWDKDTTGGGTYTGLEAMAAAATGAISVRFDTASGITAGANVITLHYCALEITYCAEGRYAAGGYDLTNGVAIDNDLFYVDVPMFSISSGAGFYWQSTAGQEAALVAGQAVIGATSQTFPMPVTVDRLLPARDTFRGHRGVVFRKTIRAAEEWTREEEESVPAVALFTSTTTFDSTTIVRQSSQVYVAQLADAVASSGSLGNDYALLIDDVLGRVYTHVRFYARRIDATSPGLTVRYVNSSNIALGPQASISVTDFEALPEIANGWKEVTLALSAPITGLGTGTIRLAFTSTTESAFPWEVLGGDANPYRSTTGAYDAATYGDSTAYARVAGTNDLSADLSVTLIAAMPVPGDFAVSPAVQPLTVVDEYCGVPVEAMPTGIRYFELSWDPVNDLSVGGFGYYEVQRRDTTMDAGVWETVAEVTSVTTTTAADYEARVGVETRYRLRTVHEDGYTSAWTSEVAVTIAAPGVTGTGVDVSVLILTSNEAPDWNLAYVMSWDGSGIPSQEFDFIEGDETTFRTMYQRDYAVAFRPTERGGVTFTRTLLVNAAGVPTATLDSAVNPLRDLAHAQLPYVCVRDERHNRWLTAMSVPSGAMKDVPRRGHLVQAPVEFREVTATPAPVDYDDATCEGILRDENTGSDYWYAAPPSSMLPANLITDTFTRSVSSGWGNATPTGQAWSATGGSATDFNVGGSTATILTGTANAPRIVTSAPVLGNYARHRIEMVVPAVATGASYTAGLVVRHQNSTNYYTVLCVFLTTGQYRIDIQKVVAGTVTTIVTGTNIDSYTTSTRVFLEVMVQGTRIVARAWRTGDPLPAWDDTSSGEVPGISDSSLAMGGRVGVIQNRLTSNTNTTLTITYDNFLTDTLPAVYDLRMLVRAVDGEWGAGFALEPFGVDQEGGWAVDLTSQKLGMLTYGRSFTELESFKIGLLGVVRNRLAWVRLVISPQDNGSGVMTGLFYRLEDDGVTWTLVDTINSIAPAQPMQPAVADAELSVSAWQGEIWIERWEVRVDGTLVASPDFAAQAPGTTSFADAQGNVWSTDGEAICADLA